MKANLNTNLFPIINVGMYYSPISPENVFDSYNIDDDFENGYSEYNADQFWDNFDNDKYKAKIQELAADFLTYEIDENFVKIEAGELYSPKYYNFDTDNVELIVEFDKVKILNNVFKDVNAFDSFLKENYSSYDGFCSFTANNFDEWYIDYKDEKETAIGALLTYLFKDSDYKESFNMYVFENIGFYSDFYTN